MSPSRQATADDFEESPADDLPLLFLPDEVMTFKQAVAYTGWDPKTVRKFVERFGIMRRAGGRIEVNRLGLEMALHGDTVALQLLRAGERRHPHVARYSRHCGLAACG